jgi:putative heme-binding domain-containing protein
MRTLLACCLLTVTTAPAQTAVEKPTQQPDAYNTWKLALNAGAATDPRTIELAPGFKIELLRSATPEEDSWVSMAFDPQGRLTIGCEKKGLLRMTLQAGGIGGVERINDSLLECRGLLYAYGALYAVANNSKALVRLRSSKGDDQLDEITELVHTEGGVGHGRNHVKLGPDGLLYVAHGNNVIPPATAPDSPLRPMVEDRLIPCPWDPQMFDGDVKLPAGHVLALTPDGKTARIVAGGFRNELDVAFNEEGEMFTFDADMEWDTGTPWYRPTRVNHVLSGADYGWRRGTSKWPEYFPDSGPTVVNIGLSSPTGVLFGAGATFPEKWRRAFFICDWSYGRILAVHLRTKGASYTGTAEPFVTGKPLNVTDAAIGPDGALYFVTGGRRTQSGLYRVSYTGALAAEPAKTPAEAAEERQAREARAVRHRLESFHGHPQPAALDEIWPPLGSADPSIRQAARVALEWQDVRLWRDRALAEKEPVASLTALMALARCGSTDALAPMLARLAALPIETLKADEQLLALRDYQLAFSRLGLADEPTMAGVTRRLDALYPAADWRANHLLCELLFFLKSPNALPKTVALLEKATRSEDLLHYLLFLRNLTEGWSVESRRICFTALNRADALEGARDYQRSLRWIRAEMSATLTANERAALGSLVEGSVVPPTLPNSGPQLVVQEWKEADLVPRLERVSQGRSFEKGRLAFAASQCAVCHRMGNAGGVLGPDLTAVASRFNRKDLLVSVLEPSKVIDEKYRNTTFNLKDGTSVIGTIEREDATAVVVRPSLALPATTTLRPADIVRREVSTVSPMPPGLLNVLSESQILDLLAYLESGGNAAHPDFRQ